MREEPPRSDEPGESPGLAQGSEPVPPPGPVPPPEATPSPGSRAGQRQRPGAADPADGGSRLPSAFRVIPTWLIVGFAAGFGLLALLAIFGSPTDEGRPSPQYVSGVVTQVQAGASSGSQTFLLRADDGEILRMEIRGTAEPSLPPGFLEGLVTRGTPVVVGYAIVEGQNVVLSILEAPRPSPSG
jgi:hypothetical protein